jgi:hypothetical protein
MLSRLPSRGPPPGHHHVAVRYLWILTLLALVGTAGAYVLTAGGGSAGSSFAATGGPKGNVFVSPSGSDSGSGCKRFAPARPAPPASSACKSVGKAIALARPGEVVQLLPGAYGRMTISRQSGTDSPKVIVRGDPGLPRQFRCSGGCAPGNVTASNVNVCGHGLSIRNLDSTGVYDYIYVGENRCPGGNEVSSNHDLELVNIHFNAGTLRGHDLLLKHSRIGPNEHICDGGRGGNREDNLHIWPDTSSSPWAVPYNVTLDGNLIYDAYMSSPGCGGAHADLIQTLGYKNLTVVNNVFWRPGHSFIQDGTIRGTTIGSAVIRNNFFGGPSAPGGGYTHIGNPDPGPNCTGPYLIENNTWASGGVNVYCRNQRSTFRNNFLAVSANQWNTCRAGTWNHNVFASRGVTCGTNVKRCRPTWLDPGAGGRDPAHGPNLHISPRDTCLRGAGSVDRPNSDIDGDLRPIRTRADAGADQYESARITMGRSIGHISLGTTKASVESFYGTPHRYRTARLFRGGRKARVATYRRHGSILWVAYGGNRVVGVGTKSPYYVTVGQLGVGAPAPFAATATANRWVSCRSAFVSTARGVVTQFTMSSRTGTVSAVAFVRRAFAGRHGCR